MKKETSNIIALRSKDWIISSLLELMEEKEFSKISITEIIQKADLTRQTFYRHFNSKEDVLHEYISGLYKACFAEVANQDDNSFNTMLVTYFSYWKKNKDFLALMNKSKFNYNVMEFYYSYMGNSLDLIDKNFSCVTPLETTYIKNFILGGLINIKTLWMNNNFKESPQKLAALVIKTLAPYISS